MNCARFWKGILIRRLGNPMLPAQDLLVPKAVWDREEAVKEEEFRLDPAEPRLLVSLNTGLEDYPEDPVEEDPWRVLAWSMAASPWISAPIPSSSEAPTGICKSRPTWSPSWIWKRTNPSRRWKACGPSTCAMPAPKTSPMFYGTST